MGWSDGLLMAQSLTILVKAVAWREKWERNLVHTKADEGKHNLVDPHWD
jgi:hypothetical protein